MSAFVHCILGLDPGASGAIAFYFPEAPDRITAEDVPLIGKEIDGAALARRIRQMGPTLAVIERVGAMPRQGVSSTFKFGTAYGLAQGVVAALEVPTHFVTPASWKKHFRLDADKERARAQAIRLWPSAQCFGLVKHHGRAEAALIARWAAETMPSLKLAS